MIISIDVVKTKRQAHEIQDLSIQLARELNELKKTEEVIRRTWVSPASAEFLKKLAELEKNIQTSQKNMNRLAERIYRIADDYQRHEEEMKRKAAAMSIGN